MDTQNLATLTGLMGSSSTEWVDKAFARFETVYDLKLQPQRLAALKSEWKRVFSKQPILAQDAMAAVEHAFRVSSKMPSIPEFSSYWKLIVARKHEAKHTTTSHDNFFDECKKLGEEIAKILKNSDYPNEPWSHETSRKISEDMKRLRQAVNASQPGLDKIQQLKAMLKMIKPEIKS